MSGESLRCFTEKDTDGPVNEGVAILGYGNLGRSFALNLRDAGLRDVTIGNIEDDYAGTAHADGFRVQGIAEASRSADLVVMLLPDEIIPEIFAKEIVPNLSPGTGLVFASGYCLAYKLVVPPPGMDVLMLAPRMGVEIIRRRYQNGDGFHSFLSVEQDASGKAWQRLLGLAKAVGALRAGAFALDARSEANLDLFIEQRLGAVVGFAIMSAFSIGVESGLPPEHSRWNCTCPAKWKPSGGDSAATASSIRQRLTATPPSTADCSAPCNFSRPTFTANLKKRSRKSAAGDLQDSFRRNALPAIPFCPGPTCWQASSIRSRMPNTSCAHG
ncbi:MAG TPA: NAD(P)-binding domain-containing protein [Gemmataceae bacterium]|nr:NAD(P)-binding domain-containing protein [Gemmataceae bacterium]